MHFEENDSATRCQKLPEQLGGPVFDKQSKLELFPVPKLPGTLVVLNPANSTAFLSNVVSRQCAWNALNPNNTPELRIDPGIERVFD